MPIHPRFVHFPIAFLFVGALALLYALLRREDRVARWGWVTLLIGWVMVMPAILTGLVDQSRGPQTPEWATTVNQHITGGIGVFVLFGYALYERLRAKRPLPERTWVLVLVLMLGLGVLIFTGEWGGRLAYSFRSF